MEKTYFVGGWSKRGKPMGAKCLSLEDARMVREWFLALPQCASMLIWEHENGVSVEVK